MPESSRITIRVPARLLAAAERKAAKSGRPLGEWVRSLIEDATGVSVPLLPRTSGLPAARRREIARAARQAREDRREQGSPAAPTCSLCGHPLGDLPTVGNAGRPAHKRCYLDATVRDLERAGLRPPTTAP